MFTMLVLGLCMCLLIGQMNAVRNPSKNEKTKAKPGSRTLIANECNGVPVTTSESSGELYHYRYPNGYYAGTCIWNIESGGEPIELLVDFLDNNCRRGDYLSIVDTGSGTELYRYCGVDYPGIFTASSGSATVTFYAGRSSRRYDGFFINYNFVSPPVPGSPACTYPGELIMANSGEKTSDGYNDDESGGYNDNSDCRWEIKVDDNTNAFLEFERFNVEYEDDCAYDYVEVYDGGDMSADLISTLCGTNSPAAIKSTGSSLFVRFFSDGSVTAPGFKFLWSTLTPGTINDGSEPGCGDSVNEVTTATGSITSPNYGSNYPADSECSHRITVGSGMAIQITIDALDIEDGADCDYDRLMIFNGAGTFADLLFDGTICGSIIPTIPQSSTNQIFILFESDMTKEAAGFSLSWVSLSPPVESGEPCGSGMTISASSGSLSTSGYGNNADCSWHISAPGQIVLGWDFVDIEYESNCNYDVLTVYDGSSPSAKVLHQFCDTFRPSAIKSSGTDLYIRLQSDGSVVRNGFSASFVVGTAGTPDDGSAPGCGGSAQKLSGGSTTFTSPGYDGSSDYGTGANCAWQIEATPGKNIIIYFTNFDVENFYLCDSDSVKVFVGGDTTYHVTAVKCGPQADFSVYVRSSDAFVTFTSDLSNQGIGFQASWVEVDPVAVSCGLPDASFPIKSKEETNQKIIGGAAANPHSLPWQIALYTSGSFICGGSVLSSEWIVTAAHCTNNFNSLSIMAGGSNRLQSESSQQSRSVVEKYVHPGYTNNGYDWDISVLKLSSPLNFDEYVQPVCLASEDVPDDTICITSGWGTSDSGNLASTLEQVFLPITNQAQCANSYSELTDNMICGGQANGGIDACQGDSGGPLVCQNQDSGAWELHGVTSWGAGCAEPGYPGVWARITALKNWVQTTTNDAGGFA